MSTLLNTIISRISIPDQLVFTEGCLFLVDKPLEWTSFDVVNKLRFTIRYAINVKKIKVGHAGTLDPLASGLLLVCAGKYTKSISELQGMNKAYTGIIRLGATTPTYDAESEPDSTFPVDHIKYDDIVEAAEKLTGKIEQMPPVYSAIKVKGQTAYSLARRGKKVELEPRSIEIIGFEITKVDGNDVHFFVSCSKGTYIRSLAHDFGKILDSGAYLAELRRVSIGPYNVKDALSIEDITEIINRLAAVED